MSAIDCTNCGRVVADGYELCTLCADKLCKELLAVPGLISDLTVTRARLDRMSRGRVGGKSSEAALPRAPRPVRPAAISVRSTTS
ncbi:hypothetical protein [Rhodococcus daqingensis]|uniref:Uncharacterized protein n=1 Tax=Rhodococcus daqingensis TaxID=2479363 RepID=A0ABW2RVM1_9NOCA